MVHWLGKGWAKSDQEQLIPGSVLGHSWLSRTYTPQRQTSSLFSKVSQHWQPPLVVYSNRSLSSDQGPTLIRYRSAAANIINDIGGGVVTKNLSRRRLGLFLISGGGVHISKWWVFWNLPVALPNDFKLNSLYKIRWSWHEIQMRISGVKFQANQP